MWLPRRVKNTGQPCAHCDPVPIRRPATGLNGERACGASLEPRGGEPKKSPRQNHATAWGRKPRAPEYASNDAKSSQIDFCVLDWPKRHRPPSIISEGRKGDSFVLRKNRAKFASKRKSVDRTNGATRSPSATTECVTRSLRDTAKRSSSSCRSWRHEANSAASTSLGTITGRVVLLPATTTRGFYAG